MVFTFLKPKPKAQPARRASSARLPDVIVGRVGAAQAMAATSKPSSNDTMKKLRRPPTSTEMRVGDVTMAWLQSLPTDIRPLKTCHAYPHVVNHLAGWWDNAEGLGSYFEDLLYSSRSARVGFPPPIKAEIENLRAFASSQKLLR